ncbi:MAG: excinuclease ABC subunit UvrA [Acidobacteriota bacterium]
MGTDSIQIRGASQHNLKGIDLDIPRSRLVVITGLSGSGKSSLAFDTLYAEGQRRYVESLSAYSRQFLDQLEKPECDRIDGLSPAIAIDQRMPNRNPRSTVGTVTEIYDFLRLLFARVGIPHCHRCGREISIQTVPQIAEWVLDTAEGDPALILAPMVRGRKGEHRKVFEGIRRKGFLRARIDGQVVEIGSRPPLARNRRHTVEAVVDRLIPRRQDRARLAESLELALQLGDGLVTVSSRKAGERTFSEHLSCVDCGVNVPEMSPRTFSFNSPYGACAPCGGLGIRRDLDPARVVPDPRLSISQGALAAWRRGISARELMGLRTLAREHKFDLDQSFGDLPEEIRNLVLFGSGSREYDFEYSDGPNRWRVRKPFEGVIPNLWRRFRATSSNAVREEIEKYMAMNPCRDCRGRRLKPESLAVHVDGRSISSYVGLEIGVLNRLISEISLRGVAKRIATPILKEIGDRLRFLLDVGIGYLTLDRTAATLSAGEAQRIRLATQLGLRLTGVLYVLDEPSIGLHQRDHRRLLNTLERIRDLGNSVIVVEHDEETIRAADHVIDLGPGAGDQGGEVVAQGSPEEISRSARSLTGAYLAGRRSIAVPTRRRSGSGGHLILRKVSEHNLKGMDVRFPLGTFTVVTGVSGSGKSTLVTGILYRALARQLHGYALSPGRHASLEGAEQVDRVVEIDSSPIGRTPRSNPATYSGAFQFIRELFSRVPESRMRGFSPSRFSFNLKGGRCESCRGDGVRRIEMHFLPDLYVTCEECHGRRYGPETLEIRYKGKSIAEVLAMTIDQAREFFSPVPLLHRKLETLASVGLGYLTLGQPAPTLSGGEAQRLKLARELAKGGGGRTVYVLDEPTSGLHFEDIRRLLSVFQALVEAGNTILVIEHNLEVIKSADYVIDLGPEGGDQGGRIVAEGTPEAVARIPGSITGRFLAERVGKVDKVRADEGGGKATGMLS